MAQVVRRVLVVAALLVTPMAGVRTAAADGPDEPQALLDEAEGEFRQQHYRRVEDLLRRVLYPAPRLSSVDDVYRAREMLGASLWQLNELASAEREWQFLLLARPDFELDAFYYPKPMREFFDRLRDTLVKQGAIRRVEKDKAPVPPPTVLRVEQVTTIERRSRAVAFAPFGVPQFDGGRDGWGWFFAASQGTTGLTSVATFVAYFSMAMKNGGSFEFSADQKSTATALYLTSLISGAAFFAFTAWGIIDANVRHEPERIVRVETREVPVATDLRPPQPPKPAGAGGGQ